MHTPRISPAGKKRIDAVLEKHAGKNLPALFFMAATKDKVIYRECKGDQVYGKPELGPVSFDSTLQLFSMTKLATSLACVQLVERGLAAGYDDPEVIKKYLPELVRQPILLDIKDDGTEVLGTRSQPLTLRHLLTHTSGLAYEFANPLQLQWAAKNRAKGGLVARATVANLCTPLFFEPGTDFAYSHASDWAGLLVERVSGDRLGAYFDKYIFGPIGIKTEDLTFYPTDNIKARLMHMCGRKDGGTGDVVLSRGWRNIAKMVPDDIGLHSGGAGLLGTLDQYLVLLQHVLACQTTQGVISPQSWQLLFSSALPPRAEVAAKGQHTYEGVGEIIAQFGDSNPDFTSGEHATHSLAFALTEKDSPHGRRKGSGFWLGAAQTHYWIDPTTGIVGICATQILDMDPYTVYGMYNEYERALYDAIEVPAAAL